MRILVRFFVVGFVLMIAVVLVILLSGHPMQDAVPLALVACAVLGIGMGIIGLLIAMVLTLFQENLSTRCNQVAGFLWPGGIFFLVAWFKLGRHPAPEAWRPYLLYAGIACFVIAFFASIIAAARSPNTRDDLGDNPQGEGPGESPFAEGESPFREGASPFRDRE